MTKLVYKTYARGVEIKLWDNDGKYQVSIHDTYQDSQGMRRKKEGIFLEKIPLVMISLQHIYEKFNVLIDDFRIE